MGKVYINSNQILLIKWLLLKNKLSKASLTRSGKPMMSIRVVSSIKKRPRSSQDTLGNLGSGDEFSDEAFDEVFATFDKDNSGTVEKNEMVVFIKQLLGGQ